MKLNEINTNWLRARIEEATGSTYPKKTFERRIKALTPKEQDRIERLFKKIEESFEKMDEIISIRAEINKDPWP